MPVRHGTDNQQRLDTEGPVQLTLKFLTQPQAATPLDRLEPGRRAELVQTLAGIIAKTANRIGPPMISQIATTSPTGETSDD